MGIAGFFVCFLFVLIQGIGLVLVLYWSLSFLGLFSASFSDGDRVFISFVQRNLVFC